MLELLRRGEIGVKGGQEMEHDRRLAVGTVTALLVMTILMFVEVGAGGFANRLSWAGMGLAAGLSFALGYRVFYRFFR